MKESIIMLALVMSTAIASSGQVNSRENATSSQNNEQWRKPLVIGGYPLSKYPQAAHSGEKPHSRDIGGMEKLTLEKFNKIMDQKVEEFYKRMKDEVKEDKVLARKMQKPQYSDPLYFGHKRKPKKRDVRHRKFCKECGMVH